MGVYVCVKEGVRMFKWGVVGTNRFLLQEKINSRSSMSNAISFGSEYFKKSITRASLVAQWLRIRLPMQRTRVRALVREDPTCRRATKPVRHNY